MATNPPGTPAPKQTSTTANPNLRLAATTVIAVGFIGFSVYLFSIGQGTVGGAIAGMVAAHYFQSANGQTVSDAAMQAVATVGALVKPPQG